MRIIAVRLFFAFSCVILFLIAQGLIATYSASRLAATQRRALNRELGLAKLKADLADVRLTVFKLLGTMDPAAMDDLKAHFERRMADVNQRLEGVGIPARLIQRNRTSYRKIIDLHYDFYVRSARQQINGESRQLHEDLFQRLNARAEIVALKANALMARTHRRALRTTIGLLIAALTVAAIWAVVLLRTLTDRRQAERALRQSEEKYREIFNNITNIFYRTDQEGRLTVVSPAVGTILGYTEEEMLGRNVADFYVHPPKRSDFLDRLAASGEMRGFEVQIRRRDGAAVWVSVNAQVYRDENGNVLGAQGLSRDITAQKSHAAEKQRLETQLAHARKMESIGTLAGGIAHDFNNILGIVIGNTELALDDLAPEHPARAFLTEIRTAGLRAKDVVAQLLSFSRGAGDDLETLEVPPLIEEALTLLRSTTPAYVSFVRRIAGRCSPILANATQIHQILINLCTNASHAIPDTGGTITIQLRDATVTRPATDLPRDIPPGRYLHLTVADDGHGIAPDQIERIFDPYFTTKEIGKGTGMGLAVVHGIVKRYGGFIDVGSTPATGTTFDIFFPAVRGDVPSLPEDVHRIPRGNEAVLFVDDETAIAGMWREILTRLGYAVETCTDPSDALERFRANYRDFDLLISDVTMPRMSGEQLLREMRAVAPQLPAILCTGFSDTVDDERATRLDAVLLRKPVSVQEMAVAIRHALEKPRPPAAAASADTGFPVDPPAR